MLTRWRRDPEPTPALRPATPTAAAELEQQLAATQRDLAVAQREALQANDLAVRHAGRAGQLQRRVEELAKQLAEHRVLLVAGGGSCLHDELIRLRRALIDYEDQLEVCRDQHRWNARSNHPLIDDETEWKRRSGR